VQVTEVRIKLCEENNERLLAFCSVTFDHCFVVRDLKIIDGTRGLFVAMPSRKLTDRCGGCGGKNHLKARFCNGCGRKLDEARAARDLDGRAKLHADIAHPIHAAARGQIQTAIERAYQDEKERSKLPNYVCRYDDYEPEYDPEPLSYGTAVTGRPGYTAHPGHPMPPRGPSPAPVREHAREEFGAGL
jgi:stage V sporulation protein G